MSKSLKLKNNNYWDSKGITHNKELLSDILENMPLQKITNSIFDETPKTFSVVLNSAYLFINTHANSRSVVLLTTWESRLDISVIYKNSDNAVPTFTMKGSNLTITGSSYGCRGSLYHIVGARSN